MSNWTPEAHKYFEGYLDQVSALAESRGDDAVDIVSDLREHIEQKVEESGHTLLTLDQLTSIMATVGSPQQVVDDGGTFEDEVQTDASSPAHAKALTANRQPETPPVNWFPLSCLVSAVLALSGGVGVVVLSVLYFSWNQPGEVISGSAQVNAYRALQELHKAQKDFQQSVTVDVNGDGIGDYGTIEQLHESERYHDVFRKMGYATGYEFLIEVTPGDENTEPGFTCIAQNEQPSRSAKNVWGESESNEAELLYMPANRHFFMDQTGVIRYTEDGTTPTVDSKPQWEAE